jgi:hypothetical protein
VLWLGGSLNKFTEWTVHPRRSSRTELTRGHWMPAACRSSSKEMAIHAQHI